MTDEAKDPGEISKPVAQPGSAGVPASQAQAAEADAQILEEHVTHAAQKPAPTPQPAPAPISDSAPAAVPAPVVPPPVAPAQASVPPGENSAPRTDISNILAGIKLPERREAQPSGEKRTQAEPKKFDTSIVGSALAPHPAPVPAPPAAPSQAAAPESTGKHAAGRNAGGVSAVHTLKDDLQGVVYNQKISLVKAVSLEEDRRAKRSVRGGPTPGAQQRSSRTFGIVFASLTLFLLGGGAIFGVLFVMKQQKAPPQADTGSSILFAEQSITLSLDGHSPGELKRILEAARTASQGALGSITHITPVISEANEDGVEQSRPATFKEFMTALGASASDDLYRALGNDFFLGIHAVDKSAPIIVVPVASHPRAFAAMLAWEPSLNGDLAPLFTAVPALKRNQNGLPTRRAYEDLVMRNYDVRALKDDAGDIQLYYSFPAQYILIIAASPYSFPEVLSRLQASRQL